MRHCWRLAVVSSLVKVMCSGSPTHSKVTFHYTPLSVSFSLFLSYFYAFAAAGVVLSSCRTICPSVIKYVCTISYKLFLWVSPDLQLWCSWWQRWSDDILWSKGRSHSEGGLSFKTVFSVFHFCVVWQTKRALERGSNSYHTILFRYWYDHQHPHNEASGTHIRK